MKIKENKKEQDLLDYLKTKVWNLHVEEKEFRSNKDYKKLLDSISKKASKILTKEEKKFSKISNGWIQQIGKIIFITSLLKELKNSKGKKDLRGVRIANKIWKERKWKLSKDKNKIIKK